MAVVDSVYAKQELMGRLAFFSICLIPSPLTGCPSQQLIATLAGTRPRNEVSNTTVASSRQPQLRRGVLVPRNTS
jgi:hypothetical protein